ncbi:N-acylneuraminate cytidylyltransferase/CMP-N,N'-diacetyllegionaminic acid synthase [Gillisia sp. Hel_I_86]|uniref:acylneuraminate cytidylyltransferase family protein n=1 Tax=Gillisia sp. Hel_I_86 TaxID=1249981 RepID=UPI00119C697E|nr:acylneuraminate cytidylyltransferase family protein [Gillisia sp. Hel_I_86]TVZ25594.1 N-acylneuraminate cytidylyltransferase/CMP-N,N'-diacetyllegionaminic acid synthase [Gillisia sp. Hel_I_86]
MKVLGIIPARGGSKGIPKKNIKLLGGIPLLEYTAKSALASKLLSRVILSSNDNEIIEVAKKIGLDVPFIRPENLSQDDTPSLSAIKHALAFFEAKNEKFDAICLLQVTTPFREEGLIDKSIQKFESENLECLISVREVPTDFNPHWIFEADANNHLKIATGEDKIISRRQDLPKAFHRDGAIYITKTDVILNQDSLYGNSIGYIESKNNFYVNIDTQKDWNLAEDIIKKTEG